MKSRISVLVLGMAVLAGCGGRSADGGESASPGSTATTTAHADSDNPPSGQLSLVPAGVLSSAAVAGNCSLDSLIDGRPLPNDGTAVLASTATPLVASGWLVGSQVQPPAHFQIVLVSAAGNGYGFASATGILRTDVSKIFKTEQVAYAGYETDIKLTSVAVGRYRIFTLVSQGNIHEKCDARVTLNVTSSGS